MRALILPTLLLFAACAAPEAPVETPPPAFDPASRVLADPASDEAAIAVAQKTVDAMGGWQAWDRTRFVEFKFFGQRQHYWDRESGDWRMEATDREGVTSLVLMNVESREGRVWRDDVELEGEELAEALEGAYGAWINDTYWMFMPFKLVDPGVTLTHGGETTLDDGQMADVLVMTFADGAGITPRNRYDVLVGKDSGLVEAWSFYGDRDDPEPRFTMPWANWQSFGEIMIATDHGRGLDWAIAVHDTLPRSVFEDPAPVEL